MNQYINKMVDNAISYIDSLSTEELEKEFNSHGIITNMDPNNDRLEVQDIHCLIDFKITDTTIDDVIKN